MSTPVAIPDRLRRCMEAGSVEALFPILKDWPQAELKALVEEIDEHYLKAQAAISAGWQQFAFLPENLSNPVNAKQLDKDFDAVQMEIFGVLTEISSVAQFYLSPRNAGPGGVPSPPRSPYSP